MVCSEIILECLQTGLTTSSNTTCRYYASYQSTPFPWSSIYSSMHKNLRSKHGLVAQVVTSLCKLQISLMAMNFRVNICRPLEHAGSRIEYFGDFSLFSCKYYDFLEHISGKRTKLAKISASCQAPDKNRPKNPRTKTVILSDFGSDV